MNLQDPRTLVHRAARSSRFAAGALLAFLALIVPRTAQAQIVITSTDASYEFSVFGVGFTNIGEGPVFRGDDVLLYPGSVFSTVYPTLQSQLGPVQSIGGQRIAPTSHREVADRSRIGNGTDFGSAGTEIAALVGGSATAQGSSLRGSGVFYSSTFATSSAAVNVASVSIARATATFTNNGPAVSARPGSLLNVSTTLGPTVGSYTAVGLVSRIRLFNPGAEGPVEFDLGRLVMAYQGLGSEIGGLVGSPSNPRRASGVLSQTLPSALTLETGAVMEVSSTITLIADPDSTINIESFLPNDFTGEVPEFGVFAGGITAIPEPSVAALAGVGLLVVAVGHRCGRGRRIARRSA